MSKIYFISIVIFIIVGIIFLSFNPIVINNIRHSRSDMGLKVGEQVQPLEQFNFIEGNWKAFLIIASNDKSSWNKSGSVFITEDRSLLEEIKNNWTFEYTGADLSTVESYFLLYENDVLKFSSGIVLSEDYCGLQNINYGWLKSDDNKNFYDYCSKFERGIKPLYVFEGSEGN